MTDAATLSAHGELLEPMTVRIERMLPGPIERVWSYLTDSEMRGRWLATGAGYRNWGEVRIWDVARWEKKP